ncbi:hypothetical protein NUSPORA_00632 [Nucleospora cyclopteri]
MKKSYKPYSRITASATNYENKTLKITDNLNIKRDEDGFEDVDAFWPAAESLLGNTTMEEIINEENKENIEISINKDNEELSLNKDNNEELSLNINNNNNNKDNNEELSLNNNSNDNELSLNINNSNDNINNNKDNEELSLNINNNIINNDDFIPINSTELKGDFLDFSTEIDLISNETNNNKIGEKSDKQMTRLKFSRNRTKQIKENKKKHNHFIDINHVKEKRNKLTFLKATNTCAFYRLSLNREGKAEEEENSTNLEVFLVTGNLEVKLNRKIFRAKRGDSFTIEKGDSYEMVSKSVNGTEVMMVYTFE